MLRANYSISHHDKYHNTKNIFFGLPSSRPKLFLTYFCNMSLNITFDPANMYSNNPTVKATVEAAVQASGNIPTGATSATVV